MTEVSSGHTNPLPPCPEHTQPAKWICGVCGKPVCSLCKPVGLNFQVFHRPCLPQAHERIDKQEKIRHDVEAPSPGVKFIGWLFIVGGLTLFGLGLFLLGMALFSRSIPIRALMSSPIPVGLDAVPGSRNALQWMGAVSLIVSVGVGVVGVGLLNCIKAARRLVLVFSWLEVIVAVLGWLMVLLLRQGFWDIPILPLIWIWFFSREEVKRQFDKVL